MRYLTLGRNMQIIAMTDMTQAQIFPYLPISHISIFPYFPIAPLPHRPIALLLLPATSISEARMDKCRGRASPVMCHVSHGSWTWIARWTIDHWTIDHTMEQVSRYLGK